VSCVLCVLPLTIDTSALSKPSRYIVRALQAVMAALLNYLSGVLLFSFHCFSFVASLPAAMMRRLIRSLAVRQRTAHIAAGSFHPASLSSQLPSSASASRMPPIPPEAVQYAQLPAQGKCFTASTIPKGLLKQHSTKQGTWGVIRVSKGQLEYQIHREASDEGQSEGKHTFVLDASRLGIIEPTIMHQVRPLTEDVEFTVEFHKVPVALENKELPAAITAPQDDTERNSK
jgi:tellurite resistance-related uncharacterized protein